MPHWIQIITPSFLEALTVLAIAYMISIHNKLGIFKSLIFALLFAIISFTMDYFEVPFHIIISMFSSAGLFILLKKSVHKANWFYAIDIILATVILALIQLMITAIVVIFSIDFVENTFAFIVILSGLIIIFIGLSPKTSIRIFFEKYYYPYRKVTIYPIMSIVFIITIIGNIFFYYDYLFSAPGAYQIIIVIIGYFFINFLFGIYFLKVNYMGKEKKAMVEYGEHLQNIVNSVQAKIHDIKHHFNIISSYNTNLEGEEKTQKIDEYIKELFKDSVLGDVSIIKDDVLISAMLHQKIELARQKDINFNVCIANSLKAYRIPHFELTNILINLIENAFDAVENLDVEDRVVQLHFLDNIIEIGNKVSLSFIKIDANKIDHFFKQGYSTKGSERGFGLSNVLTTVEKYNMKICSRLEDNMFFQEIEFPDEE